MREWALILGIGSAAIAATIAIALRIWAHVEHRRDHDITHKIINQNRN